MGTSALHQVSAGPPGAPAVVWVHGYTMSGEVWAPLWERLPQFRHVAVDLPSHGRSPEWSPAWELADVAAMVAQVCERESAHALVAMSFGSTVALQLLLDRPDVVRRAVLAAATIAEPPDDPVAAGRMRQLARARRLGVTPGGMARLWMSSPPDIFTGLAAHPDPFEAMARLVARHRFAELEGSAMRRAFSAVQTDRQLAGITAEVAVVVGEHDMPRFTGYARRLERVVPGCRTVWIPQAGHLPLQERPDACLPALRSVLDAAGTGPVTPAGGPVPAPAAW